MNNDSTRRRRSNYWQIFGRFAGYEKAGPTIEL